VLDEHVGHVLFAELEVEGECAVVVPGEETHAGGFDGGDDQTGLSGGGLADLPEVGGAGLLNFGVGRKILERENVVSGEAEDRFGGDGAGEFAGAEDGGVEGLGGFVVGDDDETGCAGGAHEEGKIEGSGGEGEARHTSAPRAFAEMTAYTLESFRMLHVCEELADEGKNHAELILVDLEFFASNWSSIWLRWER
jgi:hypothetical protein